MSALTCIIAHFTVFVYVADLTYVNFAPKSPSESNKIVFIFSHVVILLLGLIANVMVIVWITRGKPKKSRFV